MVVFTVSFSFGAQNEVPPPVRASVWSDVVREHGVHVSARFVTGPLHGSEQSGRSMTARTTDQRCAFTQSRLSVT